MKSHIAFILFSFLFSYNAFGQSEFMFWSELGAEGEIVDDLEWKLEINSRFGEYGLETFFPQAGFSYKVSKWLKPSVEYRYLVERNDIGNFKPGHRINLNANLDKNVERLKITTRIRYQFVLQNSFSGQYDPDFDQALRIKPGLEYDIDNSMITPEISAELFYNPVYGPQGRQVSKMRYAAGFGLELDGPHKVSWKYQVDHYLDDPERGLRHVLSISYGYKF